MPAGAISARTACLVSRVLRGRVVATLRGMSLLLLILVLILAICWGSIDAASATSRPRESVPVSSATGAADLDIENRDGRS